MLLNMCNVICQCKTHIIPLFKLAEDCPSSNGSKKAGVCFVWLVISVRIKAVKKKSERSLNFSVDSLKSSSLYIEEVLHGAIRPSMARDFMGQAKKKKGAVARKEVKTRIKNPKLIDRRRKQIIDGAIQVFTAKGFHSATVREIAEAAGLTMGSLYNYIRSKEDIIYIVYDYITRILREEVIEAIAGLTDPGERLKVALRQNLHTIYEYQDVVMFIYKASTFLDTESLHEVLARETEYIELFENLLRDYFKETAVDETRLRLAADLLTYIPVIVTFRRWSLRRRFGSMETVMKGIHDFVLHGIEFISSDGTGAENQEGEKA